MAGLQCDLLTAVPSQSPEMQLKRPNFLLLGVWWWREGRAEATYASSSLQGVRSGTLALQLPGDVRQKVQSQYRLLAQSTSVIRGQRVNIKLRQHADLETFVALVSQGEASRRLALAIPDKTGRLAVLALAVGLSDRGI